ncbi:ATP-binding protein [Clostridium ganghwense]|uniref:tRNA 2-thiocytidine(32) synthetase TtcA n=1 Tax=Clostridium ganghwense TaxID=312089 RepID=A0ABT4CL79_9CLOT|nr:ATP-binding protein [Clostridium ganghwense]MCY6369805.1 tRNA 2-thiocytidine(32) synthetase TtcA [Clostridium ganghwense]
MQKLLSRFRKAVTDFNLIQSGDKIAVGLSGGKDSITLLQLLAAYKRFSPEPFELIAITIDPGSGANFNDMIEMCKDLNVPYYLFKTRIQEIVFDIRKEKNPCSLCANLRRGSLNDHAKKLGCNKIALGHHKNDAIETLLLSMFYEGRINTFLPKTYLDRSDITIIRPMIYIDEQQVITLAEKYKFPIVVSECPANGFTKREYMKNLTYKLEEDIPGLKNNLLNSLSNTEQLNIWFKENKES